MDGANNGEMLFHQTVGNLGFVLLLALVVVLGRRLARGRRFPHLAAWAFCLAMVFATPFVPSHEVVGDPPWLYAWRAVAWGLLIASMMSMRSTPDAAGEGDT